MGFVDRLSKLAKGARKFTSDTFDSAWDSATASWRNGVDFEDIGRVLSIGSPGRLAVAGVDDDIVNFTKRYGFGAAKSVAVFAKDTVVEPVKAGFEALNFAYREGVSEPISTALTAGSLMEDPSFQKRLDGLSWADKARTTFFDAHHIAEDRSPGQALFLAVTTKSITDDSEVEEAEQNPWFNISTGLVDAALQVYADPFDLAVDAVKIARGKASVRALADLADNGVESLPGAQLSKYVDDVIAKHGAEEAPAVVRNRLFPSRTSREGDTVASLLVDAKSRREDEFDLLLRTFAGNGDAFDELAAKAPHYADTAASAMAGAQDYVSIVEDTMTDLSGRIVSGRRIVPPGTGTHGEAAMNLSLQAASRANEELTRIEGIRDLFGVWDKAPRLTDRGAIREVYTRSALYQENPLFRPLRTLNRMNPRRALNVHMGNLDVDVQRAMEEIGADVHAQNLYRSAMMNARTAGERRSVIDNVHQFIVSKVADDIGLDLNQAQEFQEKIALMREEAQRAVSTTFTGSDGIDRLWLMDDDLATLVEAPALSSHLSNYAWLPNTKQLAYLAKRTKVGRGSVAEHLDDAVGKFYALWKPSALLGLRTPIRVGTDEAMRRIADMGVVAVGQDVARQIGSKFNLATPAGESYVEGVTGDFAPAFGEAGDNIWRQNVAETANPGPFYGRREKGIYNADFGLRDWRSIKATDAKQFDEAYLHAANKQIPASPLARRLMENGMDRDEAVEWLRSGDGFHVMRTADDARKLDSVGWVDEVASQVEWLLPTEPMREAALRGEATAADYIKMFGSREATPPVHGQYLRDVVLGKSSVFEKVQDVTDSLMTRLNSKPTIFLQRNPHFARKYEQEVLRLEQVALRDGVELTDELATTFENRARRYALEQVRDLLFDMAESSSLADTFKVMAPFANATREVITRWSGIVWRDPSIARRLQQVWSSPEKAGLVVDMNGNEVMSDGRARTPDGKVVDSEGARFIRIPIPSGLPIPDALKPASGSIRFSKESFNTIIANPFGVGPVVTAAASVLLRDKPDVQQSMQWLFPYGVPENVIDAFKPTAIRRLTDRSGDHSYESSKIYYFNTLYAEWAESGRELGPGETMQSHANKLWKEAAETAKVVANIKTFTSLLLPVQPNFTSPYEPYITMYRRYQKEDPTTASLRFAEDFGTELLSLTTSVTKSVNGVPPTLEGWRGYRENKDAIDNDPELGRVILGEVGGEFNRAVYQGQLRSGQRRRRTKEEVIASPEIEAGWQEYTKAMDGIDAIRLERGLPNLNVKRARTLAEAKRQITAEIATRYPEWDKAFSSIDPKRGERRIEDLRRIIDADPKLRDRNDIQGLEAYIKLRDSFVKELSRRKASGRSSTLTAKANIDVARAWETERMKVVSRYVNFGPLFYRYFEFDSPEAA